MPSPASTHHETREAVAALIEAYALLRAIGRRAREQALDEQSSDSETAPSNTDGAAAPR